MLFTHITPKNHLFEHGFNAGEAGV